MRSGEHIVQKTSAIFMKTARIICKTSSPPQSTHVPSRKYHIWETPNRTQTDSRKNSAETPFEENATIIFSKHPAMSCRLLYSFPYCADECTALHYVHAYIQAHIGFPRDCRFVSGVRTHKPSTTDINEGTCNDYKGLIDAANLRGYDYWGHSNK